VSELISKALLRHEPVSMHHRLNLVDLRKHDSFLGPLRIPSNGCGPAAGPLASLRPTIFCVAGALRERRAG